MRVKGEGALDERRLRLWQGSCMHACMHTCVHMHMCVHMYMHMCFCVLVHLERHPPQRDPMALEHDAHVREQRLDVGRLVNKREGRQMEEGARMRRPSRLRPVLPIPACDGANAYQAAG